MENLEQNQGVNPEANKYEMARQELQRRQEEGDLESHPFDLNLIWYHNQKHLPITRTNVGRHPIVIPKEVFHHISSVEIIRNDGEDEKIDLEANPDNDLIIFPNELGDEE